MTEPLAPQPKAKPILFSLLTLLSGIVIGVGATLMLVPQQKPDPVQKGPEWISERMIGHLIHELNIPEEERDELREKLKPIIEEHMTAINKIREEAQPKISALINEMNEQILASLNDEQKLAWEEQIKRMKEFFERARRRGPGRGDNRGPRGPGRPDQDFDGPRGDRSNDPNSPDFRRRRFNGERPPEGMLPPGGQPFISPQPEPMTPPPVPDQP